MILKNKFLDMFLHASLELAERARLFKPDPFWHSSSIWTFKKQPGTLWIRLLHKHLLKKPSNTFRGREVCEVLLDHI